MGLLDLFSNAFSGAGNAIGGAAGGLASLFDQGQPQRGQRDFGGFLNDYFRGLVPHQPTQQEYAAMLPQMFGQQAPNGQMFANSDPNKAPQLGDNGAPLAHFDTMSGGIVPGDTASKVAGLYANLPPQLGVPALLQLAGKFTDPKEGYTLNPGQTRFGPNNTALASNTDETYGEPMPLPNGAGSVRFGNRGGAKFVPMTQSPATKLDFAAPGTTPVNPYTGVAAGPSLGGFKTLTPSDLGLAPDALSPGTIIQQGPNGEISIKKASDVKSNAAFQQDVNLTGADATARAKAALDAIDPSELADQIDAIGQYHTAPPGGFASGRPLAVKIMAGVMQKYPGYQAQNFTKSQAGYKAFASGKQGDQMRFADNAIGHMNTALELADALGNGNLPLFNRVGQAFAQQTGSAAPTNFDTAKQIIAGEVVKAITGAGGALADRQEAENTFSKASSPAQLKGAIQTAQTLLARQLQGLGRQYKNSTMRDDFASLISPEASALLQGANAGPTGGDPLSQARAAIAKGADKNAVIQRLKQNNIDPSGL